MAIKNNSGGAISSPLSVINVSSLQFPRSFLHQAFIVWIQLSVISVSLHEPCTRRVTVSTSCCVIGVRFVFFFFWAPPSWISRRRFPKYSFLRSLLVRNFVCLVQSSFPQEGRTFENFLKSSSASLEIPSSTSIPQYTHLSGPIL